MNVRAGDYTIRFSYIGYATQLISEVRITTGQTTRYDLDLNEEIIQGEEVMIIAERPLIQKDLTASRKTVVSEEIQALPVEGFFGVIATQAGVNTGPGGEIHIRGGRSNEVSYLVDGMSVGNPFETNGLATTVAKDAIQELTVISGAFNAEYGQAMSGIVNVVTKEGADRLEASFSAYGGDYATSHNDIYGTPTGFDANIFTAEGTLSGPVPFWKKLKFFVSGRFDQRDGTTYGVREHLPSDSANFNADEGLLEEIQKFIPDYSGPLWYYELHGKPWYEYGEGEEIPSEVVPMDPRKSGNIIGKLSMRPMQGAKLEYTILTDWGQRKAFNFAYRFNPDGVSTRRDKSLDQRVQCTHTLSDRSFYMLQASYATNNLDSYLYEDPFDERYVSTGAIRGFPGNQYVFGGNQKGFLNEESTSFRIRGEFTKQIGTVHEVKAGGDMQRHTLQRQNYSVLYDGDLYREPTLPDVSTPAHDVLTNQDVTQFSLFIQDKLEFDNFIINAGLRYERFDPHGQYIPDLLDPQGKESPLEEAQTTNVVMPRLGVSFPITSRGIIHFSYGHFVQMPTLRTMYLNPEFEFGVGSTPVYGNTNLKPERGIQYEMGLQQQISSGLAFDVTGYFKDIRDYRALQTIRFSTISGEDVYQIWLNKDYANIKGVVFALTKRRSRNGLVGATLDYTFQIAEGNNTDANSFFFNSLSGKENELEIVPLSFDQRHIVSGTVTLTKSRNWGLSLIGQFSTGYPYTPLLIDQKIDELPRQSRKPSQIKLDLHVYKDFQMGTRGALRLFAKVFNVLDRLNEREVFSDTGRATYSLSGQRGVHASWESAYGQPGIHDLDEYNTRPQWYSSPREIRIGVNLSY
jgi:outer membrane receptor protein involved in Fe transport